MAYIIFDTETTGLNPKMGDRIVEIAAVKVVNGRISNETFDSLINPHRLIDHGAARVNRITNEMLRNAPESSEVIPKFLDFVGSDTLVAHNAGFDLAFLANEMMLLGLNTDSLPKSLCTLELAKKKLPDLARFNLNALIQHFGISTERRHRALDDVLATAEVFCNLHEESPTLF